MSFALGLWIGFGAGVATAVVIGSIILASFKRD